MTGIVSCAVLGTVMTATLIGAAGCQGPTATAPTNADALKQEGERLRKEHQKEMSNK